MESVELSVIAELWEWAAYRYLGFIVDSCEQHFAGRNLRVNAKSRVGKRHLVFRFYQLIDKIGPISETSYAKKFEEIRNSVFDGHSNSRVSEAARELQFYDGVQILRTTLKLGDINVNDIQSTEVLTATDDFNFEDYTQELDKIYPVNTLESQKRKPRDPDYQAFLKIWTIKTQKLIPSQILYLLKRADPAKVKTLVRQVVDELCLAFLVTPRKVPVFFDPNPEESFIITTTSPQQSQDTIEPDYTEEQKEALDIYNHNNKVTTTPLKLDTIQPTTTSAKKSNVKESTTAIPSKTTATTATTTTATTAATTSKSIDKEIVQNLSKSVYELKKNSEAKDPLMELLYEAQQFTGSSTQRYKRRQANRDGDRDRSDKEQDKQEDGNNEILNLEVDKENENDIEEDNDEESVASVRQTRSTLKNVTSDTKASSSNIIDKIDMANVLPSKRKLQSPVSITSTTASVIIQSPENINDNNTKKKQKLDKLKHSSDVVRYEYEKTTVAPDVKDKEEKEEMEMEMEMEVIPTTITPTTTVKKTKTKTKDDSKSKQSKKDKKKSSNKGLEVVEEEDKIVENDDEDVEVDSNLKVSKHPHITHTESSTVSDHQYWSTSAAAAATATSSSSSSSAMMMDYDDNVPLIFTQMESSSPYTKGVKSQSSSSSSSSSAPNPTIDITTHRPFQPTVTTTTASAATAQSVPVATDTSITTILTDTNRHHNTTNTSVGNVSKSFSSSSSSSSSLGTSQLNFLVDQLQYFVDEQEREEEEMNHKNSNPTNSEDHVTLSPVIDPSSKSIQSKPKQVRKSKKSILRSDDVIGEKIQFNSTEGGDNINGDRDVEDIDNDNNDNDEEEEGNAQMKLLSQQIQKVKLPTLVKRQEQKRVRWTYEEDLALIDGIRKHGMGQWRAILDDPQFSHILAARTNVNCKDRARNLAKLGLL